MPQQQQQQASPQQMNEGELKTRLNNQSILNSTKQRAISLHHKKLIVKQLHSL